MMKHDFCFELKMLEFHTNLRLLRLLLNENMKNFKQIILIYLNTSFFCPILDMEKMKLLQIHQTEMPYYENYNI